MARSSTKHQTTRLENSTYNILIALGKEAGLLNKITVRLEDIENQVFDDRVTITRRISLLRRDVLDLLRIVSPLKETITEIISKDLQRGLLRMENLN